MAMVDEKSPIPDPTIDLHWGDFKGAIHDIFASNAKQHPQKECVVETGSVKTSSRTFTYDQINKSSSQLAQHLLEHGCIIGDVVTIYAYRSVELVVAYMGALKAGATVNVIDPQYPTERQIVLLEVANPRFLMCIKKANENFGPPAGPVWDFASTKLNLKSTIPALEILDDGTIKGGLVEGADCLSRLASEKESPVNVIVGPDTHATLSFTSGSEGKPKGVLGRHFSLTHYFPWMAEKFGLSMDDRFTMLSGIAHDPIQRDIFTPLFLGAQIIIPPADVIAYELLSEWVKQNHITVTHLTPAMGQILLGGAIGSITSLRNAFFVGDILTKKDTARFRDLAPNAVVVNLYGSTESSRAVSFFEVPSKASNPSFLEDMPDIIPCGQGMQNVQLLVVDRHDRTRLCKVGEQGELFIRAGGLAEGYLGNDERTADLNRTKFVTNWFVDTSLWTEQFQKSIIADGQKPWMKHYKGPRDRLYRSGDLGRYRADGSVECTGRIDSQVKIRGFRIELGEIDANLSQHPFIRDNVTLIRRDKDEEHTLVTYFVPETKRWFEHLQQRNGGHLEVHSLDETMSGTIKRFRTLAEDCKKFLASKVPKYAVPSLLIPLARMPLNPNGKIDKPALPFPDSADLALFAKRRSSSVSANMTDTQRRLASVWASILPNTSARLLTPQSNFFDEGGHSILAQQMFSKIKNEWKGINIPIRVIFHSQTLESLAAEIDRTQDPIGLRLDALPLAGDGDVEDEAYAADARELANQLPRSIATADANWDYMTSTPTVLVTGATGFLGSYIVHELLEGPARARVIAHVRAKDLSEGLARLETVAQAYRLWSPDWIASSRLEVVVGDISKPQLGVSNDIWDHLSNKVDLIIHNGAMVNWILPYHSLRSTNVLSTMACIRLCSVGKAKRLAFVSSTSTLDHPHYVELSGQAGSLVEEADDLEGSRKGLGTGYGQSKWASEFVVREAGRRGLAGAVIRPGYITGDPKSGISVTDDFLARLWKGCLQVGGRPDISNTLNAVPVTQVSRIVVAAGLSLPAATGHCLAVAQVTAHPRLTLNDWMGALEVFGYTAQKIPYSDWATKVREYVEDDSKKEEHALLPLLHFVVGNLPGDTIAPELDDSNAAASLKLYQAETTKNGAPAAACAINTQTLGMYLAYLVAVGFLPPPEGNTESNLLPKLSGDVSALAHFGGRSAKSS